MAASSPPRMVLLGEADQVVDPDHLAVVGSRRAAVPAKQLVHLAGDEAQVDLGQALNERGEFEIEAAVRRMHAPGAFEVSRVVGEIDLAQLVDAAGQDERVLGGGRCVAEAKAQVEANGTPVSGEGTLANLKVTLKPGLSKGTKITFRLSEASLGDANGRDYQLSALQRNLNILNGTLTVRYETIFLPFLRR